MKNIFDWGPLGDPTPEMGRGSPSHPPNAVYEAFIEKTYERFFSVEEGDVVVDIGASTGPFTCGILPNKPSKVFCIEPSTELLPFLIKNVNEDCVVINKCISHKDGEPSDFKSFFVNAAKAEPSFVEHDRKISFETFIESNKITTIDFLKTDCEGGEYDIFNSQNLKWIKDNVKKIAGEWHLRELMDGAPLKEKFIEFRDKFLPHFSYEVCAVDGTDIKWDIKNQHFLDHYSEVLFYIDNRN
jgi:FkbM family methyltransferase